MPVPETRIPATKAERTRGGNEKGQTCMEERSPWRHKQMFPPEKVGPCGAEVQHSFRMKGLGVPGGPIQSRGRPEARLGINSDLGIADTENDEPGQKPRAVLNQWTGEMLEQGWARTESEVLFLSSPRVGF